MARYFVYMRKSSETEDKQVLSLESQQRELEKFIRSEKLKIVDYIDGESRSAKQPGRPLFEDMLNRIEKGEADGIIAWHPDRLARNTVDGGRIVYLLDTGKLQDLRFPTYRFENDSQGKFMLNLIFGQSKYYVDSLSENVKRGNRTKLENGWLPGVPPIGYINDKEDHTIKPDPDRFRLVRKMWDLLLTGSYSVREVTQIANEDWGLRTRQFKRMGGKKLTFSLGYRIFSNPFYCGIISRKGETYQGSHKAMVSVNEFDRIQKTLGLDEQKKVKRHEFAFTGMIRCGECGCMITAEHQKNRFGSRYIYYRCTKKKPTKSCSQKYIRVEELDRQISQILEEITIPDSTLEWALKYLRKMNDEEIKDRQKVFKAQQKAYSSAQRKLDELTRMKLSNMVEDAEYKTWKEKLIKEKARLKEKLTDSEGRAVRWLEFTEKAFIFANRARIWFEKGTIKQKRQILQTLGSNLFLRDGILHIQLQKPFEVISKKSKNPTWLAKLDIIRTFFKNFDGEFQIPRLPDKPATVK
ncbi:recombinase family protein [bacterium]|nr:MAG: recombinase family protein [bacterium]